MVRKPIVMELQRTNETDMKLNDYFEKAKGVGVLATTDLAGQVNQAI